MAYSKAKSSAKGYKAAKDVYIFGVPVGAVLIAVRAQFPDLVPWPVSFDPIILIVLTGVAGFLLKKRADRKKHDPSYRTGLARIFGLALVCGIGLGMSGCVTHLTMQSEVDADGIKRVQRVWSAATVGKQYTEGTAESGVDADGKWSMSVGANADQDAEAMAKVLQSVVKAAINAATADVIKALKEKPEPEPEPTPVIEIR